MREVGCDPPRGGERNDRYGYSARARVERFSELRSLFIKSLDARRPASFDFLLITKLRRRVPYSRTRESNGLLTLYGCNSMATSATHGNQPQSILWSLPRSATPRPDCARTLDARSDRADPFAVRGHGAHFDAARRARVSSLEQLDFATSLRSTAPMHGQTGLAARRAPCTASTRLATLPSHAGPAAAT